MRLPPGGEPPFFAALAALLAGRASSWALLAGLFRFCAGGGSDGDEPEPRRCQPSSLCATGWLATDVLGAPEDLGKGGGWGGERPAPAGRPGGLRLADALEGGSRSESLPGAPALPAASADAAVRRPTFFAERQRQERKGAGGLPSGGLMRLLSEPLPEPSEPKERGSLLGMPGELDLPRPRAQKASQIQRPQPSPGRQGTAGQS